MKVLVMGAARAAEVQSRALAFLAVRAGACLEEGVYVSAGLYCVCGNKLDERPFRVNTSPCRCVAPGAGRSTARAREDFLNDNEVTRKQYEQRTRLGLPVATDSERALYRELR